MLKFYKNLDGIGLLCIQMKGKRATMKRAKIVCSYMLAVACKHSQDFADRMESLHKSGEYSYMYESTVEMVQSYMRVYPMDDDHEPDMVVTLSPAGDVLEIAKKGE